MLLHLIRKELLEYITSSRFAILSLLSVLVIGWSLFDGTAYYLESLQAYRDAQQATDERIQRIIDAPDEFGSWGEFYRVGYVIHKPPSPLSIFARGLDPILGTSFWAIVLPTARRVYRSPVAENPVLGFFDSGDLGTIAPTVLALFVMLFSYSAISGEKELGTLRLVVSCPVPRTTLVFSKLIAAFFAVGVTFLAPFLLGLAGLVLHPDIQLGQDEWVRLGFILIANLAFVATMVSVGLFCSALAGRSATSFVLLLSLWIGAVVVLPRLSLIMATTIVDPPSETRLQERILSARNGVSQMLGEKRRTWEVDYQQQNGERWRDSASGREAYYTMHGDSYAELGPLRRSRGRNIYLDHRNRQSTWLDAGVWFARFSPAFCVGRAAVRLAGTGLDRHRRFKDACIRYAEDLSEWTIRTQMLSQRYRFGRQAHGEYRFEAESVPRFSYREAWPKEELSTALFDIGIIVLWGLLFAIGTLAAALRYDVR